MSRLQLLPSSGQLIPEPVLVLTHPVAGTHESVVQGLASLQLIAAPPPQVPFWHVSPVVHMLASLHGVPGVLTGFEHVPVVGLQVPALWH
jgi:hypothetical protein